MLASVGRTHNKKWWSLLKQVYSDSESMESIPPLNYEDKIIIDDKEITELFNEFFLEASSLDTSNAELPTNGNVLNIGPELSSINISKEDVMDQLKVLDVTKAYGPDGLSPIFFKEGGRYFSDSFIKNIYFIY